MRDAEGKFTSHYCGEFAGWALRKPIGIRSDYRDFSFGN
jgi:hypothetical protein